MVQFAVSSMFFHEYTCDQIFDFVEEAGLTGIEFWIETPHFWVRNMPLEEIEECIRTHPRLAPITVHAPVLDLNPCSINPHVAAVSVHYALRAVEMAESLGSRTITLHPGRRTAKRVPSDADYRRFEHYIAELQRVARGKSVRVAMENMERKVNSLLCTPEDVRELLDREPWLCFTLDVAHALKQSVDEVEAYIGACGDRIANVHVSGVAPDAIHLPVAGNEDIAGIIAILKQQGYDGNLTLEIEDRNFATDLCSEEKITLLAGEVAFLQDCWDGS
jgi:sugar phosphate isomerase/epimerase